MVLPLSRSRSNNHTYSPVPLNPWKQHQQEHSEAAEENHCNGNAARQSIENNIKPPAPSLSNNKQSLDDVQSISALTLLQRNYQQASSRPCLLLPPFHDNNNTTTMTLPPHYLFPLSLGITELYGTAGAGKTQIGLSTCVSCVSQQSSNNNNAMALYVTLGEVAPTKLAQRLQQMATARNNHHQQYTTTTSEDVLQRILTRTLRNQDELLAFCQTQLDKLLQRHDISIVVLDSMAGMFRTCHENYASRSSLLFQIATNLKQLSEQYSVVILCINQVTTDIDTNTLRPALGLSWSQCVNTSIHVEKVVTASNDNHKTNGAEAVTVRRLTCVRSSSIPRTKSAKFQIDASGVVAIEENNTCDNGMAAY